MAISPIILDNAAWVDAYKYKDAEVQYYTYLSKAGVNTSTSCDSLTAQVQKVRQQLNEGLKNVVNFNDGCGSKPQRTDDLNAVLDKMEKSIANIEARLSQIELTMGANTPACAKKPQQAAPAKEATPPAKKPAPKEDDDDVDLFGSESEGEDEAAAKVREQRLAAYAAKKEKKPVLVAKSNIIFDVKPWDDETDMKQLENIVRSIEHDGLLWGAAKQVPLAYGIHKLQISSVIEDDKVSVDWLQETIEEKGSEFVQSVDIAAFNKV